MEHKFLLYLLYAILIDIRQRSYENGDKASFWLCDLMHNIPLQLTSEDGIKNAYAQLIEKVDGLEMHSWLDSRKEEFYERYPEFKINDNQ